MNENEIVYYRCGDSLIERQNGILKMSTIGDDSLIERQTGFENVYYR